MKVQLATLVLADRGYMQFKLHLHDDLRADLTDQGVDLREWLRDSLYRHLKRRFGYSPWFFFVIEDHTTAGEPTRPHAHGSIEVRPMDINRVKHRSLLRKRRLVAKVGLAEAERQLAWELTAIALKAASGNGGDLPRVAVQTGLDQCRNLWRRPPYLPLFNAAWVDYAFKNAKRVSKTLGENRLALPYGPRGEAQRLWHLVTVGETEIRQWQDP
jgi:hypothetical protein